MIKSKILDNGFDPDNFNLNTAEALGFTIPSSMLENPYIIPDGDEHLSVLKKPRPLAIA